jgi:hypothetical protein
MRITFLLLLIAIPLLVSGSAFYLSPEGNDLTGNGSKNYPWFSLERTWSAVSAGDTIYLRGGTYRFSTRQDLTGKDGKPDKYIYIWAMPGELPVITRADSFDMAAQLNLIYIDADYLDIKGLDISHFEQRPGIRAGSAMFCFTSNSVFENINYHHNAMGMIIRGNSSNNIIINCDFHHNYDPYDTEPYNHADGLDLSDMPSGTKNTVKGCRFYENADDGLDLFNNDGFVTIDSCWAWKNGYREDGVTAGGDGSGFKLGQTTVTDYTDYKRIFTNNLSFSNRTFGITQNNALCKMFICNNTFYDNKDKGIYFSPAWGDAAHMIRNNIAYKNVIDAAILINMPVIDHNSWQLSSVLSDAAFISVDWETQATRPRKPDGSLPDIDFMHLATGSVLIDAGINVGLPYSGNAPDIGAFESADGEYFINHLPEVNIYSPTKGAQYAPPATVTIDVEASDPDGTIDKVELFNGTKKLGERTTAPYSFVLKDLPEGTYLLKAVATDNQNAAAMSAVFELKVASLSEKNDFFNLFPNPNNGFFSIKFTSRLESDYYTLTIVDLIGKVVYKEEIPGNEDTIDFDLTRLKEGVYVLMISTNQILLTQKFIKS